MVYLLVLALYKTLAYKKKKTNPSCILLFLFLNLNNKFKWYVGFFLIIIIILINPITYLSGVEGTDEDRKFVEELLNYLKDEIKCDSYKNILSISW